MQTPLVKSVVETLRELLPRDLPSVRSTARLLGVSRSTAAAAFRVLAKEGVIELHARRRSRVTAAQGCVVVAMDPSRNPYERISHDIEQGLLRSGQPLAKSTALCSMYGVSPRTLCNALNRLAAASLIHKHKNRWIVGASSIHAHERATSARTIVLLQPTNACWSGLRTDRTERFITSFTHEAETYGVRVTPCIWNEAQIPYNVFAIGKRPILELIRTLGARYCGALLVGRQEQFADWADLVLEMRRIGGPVVWFDVSGQSEDFDCDHPGMSVCRFNESIFAQSGLDYLLLHGHRRILFASECKHDWEKRRVSALKSDKNAIGLGAEVWSCEECVHEIQRMSRSELVNRFQEWLRLGRPLQGKIIRALMRVVDTYSSVLEQKESSPLGRVAELVQQWPSEQIARVPALCHSWPCIPSLLSWEFSAIIASRDSAARHLYYELRRFGITIPDDLSMISYDNYLDWTQLPVTTFDNGAGHLGHWAFHHVTGISLVSRPHHKIVWAKPHVVDRGSVALCVDSSTGL